MQTFSLLCNLNPVPHLRAHISAHQNHIVFSASDVHSFCVVQPDVTLNVGLVVPVPIDFTEEIAPASKVAPSVTDASSVIPPPAENVSGLVLVPLSTTTANSTSFACVVVIDPHVYESVVEDCAPEVPSAVVVRCESHVSTNSVKKAMSMDNEQVIVKVPLATVTGAVKIQAL